MTRDDELRPISMQDVRLAVGEGPLKLTDVLAGCNAELRRRAALALASPPNPVEGWKPIETAPRDGTLFLGRNLDQPTFGSWPMYRRVKHEFVNGELQTTDLGAWIVLHDVEPDYQEGYAVGPDPEYAIAADHLNSSVRYGWRTFGASQSVSEAKAPVDSQGEE